MTSGSSDSMAAYISTCPSAGNNLIFNSGLLGNITAEEKSSTIGTDMYSGGLQSLLDGFDEEDCIGEGGQIAEKKRRLNVDQVRALEKNFEVENKLDPERKVKLAQELSLQPRQVAIWFQNRRARWKTKQLERDYGVLKASYETLKLNYDALSHDKEALLDEVRELKSKLSDETTEISRSIKDEMVMSEFENKVSEADKIGEAEIGGGLVEKKQSNGDDFKDGSEDSDSSAILNDETSPRQLMTLISPSSSINFLQFDSRVSSASAQKAYYQFIKTEDHSFLNEEETSNLLSDEHPWFFMEHWNYSM